MGGFVDRNRGQPPAEKDPLQMSGSVTELEHASAINEGDYLPDPVLPAVERNCRGNEIVREGKLVVEQSEKKAQECLH